MKQSEIQAVAEEQRAALEAQDIGVERDRLAGLPDMPGHALAVNGVRRCGKNTLLRQFIKRLGREYFYFNFDDVRLADFTPADYGLLDRAIRACGARLLLFDEIQTAERWEQYVRQKLEEGYQPCITGSSAPRPGGEPGGRLTGRLLARELHPFSYGEYRRFTGRSAGPDSLGAYLETGGFPEYLKSGNVEALAQLQSDILYRDIAVRYGIRDVASLRRLYVYLASNPARKISPSKLPRVIGVRSPATVLEYIACLEAAYLVRLAPCFAWSAKARSLAPKKVYLVDPGIIKSGSVPARGQSGAVLENVVYSELRSRGEEAYYFAGGAGGECDFVTGAGERPRCVQVCWELTGDREGREISGLLEAMEFFGAGEGVIVTFDTRDTIVSGGKRIEVIPAWAWLEGNHACS